MTDGREERNVLGDRSRLLAAAVGSAMGGPRGLKSAEVARILPEDVCLAAAMQHLGKTLDGPSAIGRLLYWLALDDQESVLRAGHPALEMLAAWAMAVNEASEMHFNAMSDSQRESWLSVLFWNWGLLNGFLVAGFTTDNGDGLGGLISRSPEYIFTIQAGYQVGLQHLQRGDTSPWPSMINEANPDNHQVVSALLNVWIESLEPDK